MINCEKYIWLQFDWGLPKKGKEIEMKKRKKYRCKRERQRKVPREIATGGDCWRERSAAEKCHNCSKTKQVFLRKG